MSQSILDQIKQARVQLILDDPFFGKLALRLELTEDLTFPFAVGTNGIHLYFNSTMIEPRKWTEKEMEGVLCHEVLHCAYQHMLRRRGRHPELFNIACDLAINPPILASGHTLPSGVLNDPKYTGWSAERIYDDLLQSATFASGAVCNFDGKGGKGQDWGQVMDAPQSGYGSPNDQLEQEWQQAVKQAAEVAKQRGKFPGALTSLVEDLIDPTVDWRSIIRAFVQTVTDRTDYTWAKPNQKYVQYGTYLPSLHGERTPPFALVFDTSGSTGSKPARLAFKSEAKALMEELKPERLYVIHSDAKVHKVEEFTPGDEVDIREFHGNGGTDFRPAFQWIEKQGLDHEIAGMVYLTDLEGPAPEAPPPYPVLWATINANQPPWGESVRVKVSGENE